jgi:D-xylose 1-dehydrogenase (NADP+, D-xylono-1,5-lactone-forming)
MNSVEFVEGQCTAARAKVESASGLDRMAVRYSGKRRVRMGEGKQTTSWGVLSTANIGRAAVIPAIQASSNGTVAAVASRDPERAREFAAANRIERSHGSYEALLDDEDIDAVYIPLPNSLHREWVLRAAVAGKHVLCEKPLGLSGAECDEMEQAARENGVLLMEAFMYRFHPRTDKVKELIRGGAIGPLRAIQSSFGFRLRNEDDIRMKPALGGGSLMDVGCYCVNVSRTLAESEPVEVQAFASWASTGVDAQMAGALRFEDGLLAQFDCALTLERRECYVAAGTEGHLTVASAFLPGTVETTIEEIHGRAGATRHTVPGADEYRLMIEHFAECALEGRAVRYPASEAAANLRVIEALYRSARNGGRPEAVVR